MYKASAKKLLLLVGTLTLALAAFIAGGIFMSSAQAASTHVADKHPTESNQTKAVVTVNSVAGNTIQATVLEPSDKKGNAVTLITTSSTVYKPDSSVVAVGKTIVVVGTVNSDGSITAQGIAFFDPSVAKFGGVISKIDGSTITVEGKGNTHTILVTDSTTFLKVQPETKATQPASLSDLKVGELIVAQGKLNSDGSLTAETVSIIPIGSGEKHASGSIQ